MKIKMIGMIISILIIAVMIGITIQSVVNSNKQSNEFDDYPSGNIKDLPDNIVDESLDYDAGLEVGKVAPNFKLQTLDGQTVMLSDYLGKKVILNFWASWCPPCRVEMPYMENYYKAFKDDENVEILAVNMTKMERGSVGRVGEFVEEHQLTFPILMDEEGKVMGLYEVMIYPTTYIINTEGIITNKVVTSLDEEIIKELIGNID